MEQKREIDIKEYIDRRLNDLEKYMNINFELDRKAVEQYSKTNDEWKVLHNGLQRKLEEERGKYVYQDRYDQNEKQSNDKLEKGMSHLDEKINMTKSNIEDKFALNLKSDSDKHTATDKQMKILIDANADTSNRGINELNVWKISSQATIRVILTIGGFIVAIVLALIVAAIRNLSN